MLAPGNAHDAPEGRKLIAEIEGRGKPLVMDRAYQDDKTRKLAEKQGFLPIVPPKKNRKEPWEYDKELYKKRNEIERFFRRIQEFRRVFTRYEKLDVMYFGVILFALIVEVFMCTRRS
jgi:transposase